MTILVTGAAGFIGSNFVLDWLGQSTEDVVSLDLLTYAGNLENLSSLNIKWPENLNIELSPKDLLGQSFKSSELFPVNSR